LKKLSATERGGR